MKYRVIATLLKTALTNKLASDINDSKYSWKCYEKSRFKERIVFFIKLHLCNT